MASPGIAKSELSYNLRKTVRKISAPIEIEIARPLVDNGNPIMLRRSVDCEAEFGRPPIRSPLIDEGY